ncbi:putative phosphoinositide phospholipase C 2 [Cocos nucifera]|uniref:Phosphoinositide phospholipase C n=1 Tax=Cocos nucifera TaxID=13894 RepID=A0A8K0I747_COCNU|nr:putative phosphoinositide phospholipase C 2 [Cocos nucifera]
MTTYRVCFCFRRRFRPASNEPPEGVKEVFRKYSEGGVMGEEQLQRFLVEVQGEAKATREAAQAVIDGMREFKHLRVFQKKGLSLEAFFRYLTGDDNSVLSHSLGMITQTYGEMLFTTKSEFLEEFPSPEALKMKIIISTKPPKEYLESKTIREQDQAVEKVAEDEAWGREVSDPKAEMGAISKSEHEHSEHHHEEEDPDEGDKKPHQMIAPEYKRLIAIAAKKGKGELADAFKIDPDKVTRLSLSELLFQKAVISHGTEIVRFTQRNLLRIYPKGDSLCEKYEMIELGLEMVLLGVYNAMARFCMSGGTLGYGRALWLVHGMFRANGGCGYVKKPDFLLDNDPDNVFDPKVTLPVKKTLKVRVYMGDGWRFDFHQTHFDTYSPPDFYTRVGIAGVPADTVMKRTKAIEDDWIPAWDEEFEFPLTVPELALLRIEVHEYDMSEKDDFAGQTCLPVWELRPGIRSVPLCDRKGETLKSVKLLMRFEFI